jgi:hypothetical protein
MMTSFMMIPSYRSLHDFPEGRAEETWQENRKEESLG